MAISSAHLPSLFLIHEGHSFFTREKSSSNSHLKFFSPVPPFPFVRQLLFAFTLPEVKAAPLSPEGKSLKMQHSDMRKEGESTAGRQFSIYHSTGKCFTPSRRALLSFIFALSKTAVATRCMNLSGETFFWKLLVWAESVSPRDMMHACKSKANSK